MLKQVLIVLSAFILTACSDNTRHVNLQDNLNKDTTANLQQIIFAEPQIIDSSHFIIYPLIFEKESYGTGYASSSGGQKTSYWNLIFYNTETQKPHLLTDNKILIYSINLVPSSSSSNSSTDRWTTGINVLKDYIFYAVVSKDFNVNKQLEQNDPTYLFVSNRDGTNFRQISPDDYNITS